MSTAAAATFCGKHESFPQICLQFERNCLTHIESSNSSTLQHTNAQTHIHPPAHQHTHAHTHKHTHIHTHTLFNASILDYFCGAVYINLGLYNLLKFSYYNRYVFVHKEREFFLTGVLFKRHQ